MKINPQPPEVQESGLIVGTFKNILQEHHTKRPKTIIECGTYLGLGTTKFILQALEELGWNKSKFPTFYTIEAHEKNYIIARENLPAWITCIHGCSVDLQAALDFIESDREMYENHERYPDIYYDSYNPIEFYQNEIKGQLNEFGGKGKVGENFVLGRLVKFARKKKPLFILDSAGGIGYLEYKTVLELMDDNPFYVWCHDINHVKHFRSYRHMQSAKNCEILALEQNEWVLSRFNF